MASGGPLEVRGRFEHATVFEALQIIGWLKKTGRLRVDAPSGRGIVLIRDGLVVGAYTSSTVEHVRDFGQAPSPGNKELLYQYILAAVRELTDLKEGEFHFSQESALKTPELGSVDPENVLLERGLSADQLAIIIAHQRDQENHAVVANEPPRPAEPVQKVSRHPVFAVPEVPTGFRGLPSITVLLVDDEAPVRRIVGAELRLAGYRVRTASNPTEAVEVGTEVMAAGDARLIVVTDLSMLTTDGESFLGGFEVVRRFVDSGIQAPVLLTAESLSGQSRHTARQLGIRRVAFKPSLSKLDPEQYVTDLRSCSSLLVGLLKKMERELDQTLLPSAGEEAAPDFLTLHILHSMSERLANPEQSLHVSRQVLPLTASLAASKDKDREPIGLDIRASCPDKSNLRQHERIDSLMIRAQFTFRGEVADCYLTDLSEEGAFLFTPRLLPVGEIIRLRIFLPYNLGEVSLEGRIVWLSYKAVDHSASAHGMGIRFVERLG